MDMPETIEARHLRRLGHHAVDRDRMTWFEQRHHWARCQSLAEQSR